MKKQYTAFTLAEVLITLGIIGVVAALTIPTLINNSQKIQYVTGYKKAYSTLAQAFQQISFDYGSAGDLSATGLFDESTSNVQTTSQNAANALMAKMKIIKDCGYNGGNSCFPSTKYLNYPGTVSLAASNSTFTTADGMSVSIGDYAGNCNIDPVLLICAGMRIDINGAKPPNQFGRDVWAIYIRKNATFVADGYTAWNINPNDYTVNCRTDAQSQGLACSARVIDEGWEMNY